MAHHPPEENQRRFVISSTISKVPGPADAEATPGALREDTPRTRRLRLVAGVVMLVLALLCLVLALGSDSEPAETRAEATDAEHDMVDLHQTIQETQSRTEGLPNARDAKRSLVTAFDAAHDVAERQNNYRYLARVAENDARLAPASLDDAARDLRPYFEPGLTTRDLGPWYLLAADVDASRGIGIPEGFQSGYEWSAQAPYAINEDADVPLTWLAADDATGEVLAWARAEYQPTSLVFTDLQVGLTTKGQQRSIHLEVTNSWTHRRFPH